MRSLSVAAWAVLLLTACASTRGYERALDSWVGSDINQLIESWGPPTQTYPMPDGRNMYTWRHCT
jgi:hypothetical protein